jgi:hypothetical protein
MARRYISEKYQGDTVQGKVIKPNERIRIPIGCLPIKVLHLRWHYSYTHSQWQLRHQIHASDVLSTPILHRRKFNEELIFRRSPWSLRWVSRNCIRGPKTNEMSMPVSLGLLPADRQFLCRTETPWLECVHQTWFIGVDCAQHMFGHTGSNRHHIKQTHFCPLVELCLDQSGKRKCREFTMLTFHCWVTDVARFCLSLPAAFLNSTWMGNSGRCC